MTDPVQPGVDPGGRPSRPVPGTPASGALPVAPAATRSLPIAAAPAAARPPAAERPLPQHPGAPEPYRLLFPLGALYALLGALPWALSAANAIPYPGTLHRMLMVEGFELCFALGFLLTALPAMTRGARCRPWELAVALALATAFGVSALAGWTLAAHAAFAAATLFLAIAALRRTLRAPVAPAEEFQFVWLALAAGVAGGVLLALADLGLVLEPAPRWFARLVSLGMVLPLVTGVGALLVPAFIGIRDPLMIPGIAKAHERRGRRQLYLLLVAALAGAFALEAAGRAAAGAWLRAAAIATVLLWVWKLWRRPGRRDLYGWALWSSGVATGLGVLLAAAFPRHEIAALHVTFVGGFGLVTLGIATRVVVQHGRFPQADECRLVSPWTVGLIAAGGLLRVAAEFVPGTGAAHALAGAALLWAAAWAIWMWGAVPRAFRRIPGPVPPPGIPVTPR